MVGGGWWVVGGGWWVVGGGWWVVGGGWWVGGRGDKETQKFLDKNRFFLPVVKTN